MFWGISDCSSDDARDHDARQNLLHSHRRASHQLDVVEVLTFRLPSEAPHFLGTPLFQVGSRMSILPAIK